MTYSILKHLEDGAPCAPQPGHLTVGVDRASGVILIHDYSRGDQIERKKRRMEEVKSEEDATEMKPLQVRNQNRPALKADRTRLSAANDRTRESPKKAKEQLRFFLLLSTSFSPLSCSLPPLSFSSSLASFFLVFFYYYYSPLDSFNSCLSFPQSSSPWLLTSPRPGPRSPMRRPSRSTWPRRRRSMLPSRRSWFVVMWNRIARKRAAI